MSVDTPPAPSPPAAALPAARPVRFVHRGRVQQVLGLSPTTTVLQWLREHARCTGTKEGCAEGDCGACTVVLGEADATARHGLRLTSVNACLQFLPTLEGKALFTVEDVALPEGLHPCQQALVDCHGSQCGFCTPGFVMSLWHLFETHDRALPRAEVAEALSGNLCRCTGYRPILDAAQRMNTLPRVPPPFQAVLDLLAPLQTGDHTRLHEGPDAAHPDRTARFLAPRTLDELAHWRLQWPRARLLAGNTDVGLWVAKQFRDVGDLIWLGGVAELSRIDTLPATPQHPALLTLGAGASLEAAWSALTQQVPPLRELWKRFASPPVRHAGTLGGNVANGSPIGDGPPVLMALGAQAVLRRGDRVREVPLSAFYLGYQKTALQEGEFLQALRVPLPEPGDIVRGWKVSKRHDSDISAVCGAFFLRLAPGPLTHPVVSQVRLAFGGMAATPARAQATEAALQGAPWDEASLRRAQAALRGEFQPLTDLRGSATYRLDVACGLLERLWMETRAQRPMPASALQVWPTP